MPSLDISEIFSSPKATPFQQQSYTSTNVHGRNMEHESRTRKKSHGFWKLVSSKNIEYPLVTEDNKPVDPWEGETATSNEQYQSQKVEIFGTSSTYGWL